MFEKEAEEYANNVFNPVQEKFFITRGLVQGHIAVAFQDGAEFGYNKAKVCLERKIEELEKERKR